MWRVLGTLLLLMALPAQPVSAAAQDSIEAKLAELEKRLQSLEQKEKERVEKEQQETEMTVELEELRRQMDILAEEVEKMRSGEERIEISREKANSLGLGSSAARVYEKQEGVSIAGYGEMLYRNFADEDQSGTPVDKVSDFDFLRAILYAGYRFNEKFLFNSEIEFEHASTDKSGSASVEFAYVEYLINENLSARGGLLLVPMGFVNELHEPNAFLGALRPQTEQVIIPTTWRENGFGAVGSYGPLNFRTYLVNGLDANGFSANGMRGGRQKGSKAKADNLAFVGRFDIAPSPGFYFGGSFYRGGSGQGQFEFEGNNLDVTTTIYEAHGQAQFRGWDFRGLFAESRLGDAFELNQLRGLTGSDAIAKKIRGGYAQGGYNLLARHHETMGLTPYYRFEKVNTHQEMPAGYLADPGKNSTYHSFGLEFRPIYNVVIKSDYQWNRNLAKTGLNQFNIGLGYSF